MEQVAGRGGSTDDAPQPAPVLRDPNSGFRVTLLHVAYDLLWVLVVLLLSPWWGVRCLLQPEFRRMALARLTFPAPGVGPPSPTRPRVLVHGVSLGEVKASQSLVAALRERYEVVVSASTDTGVEVARQLYPDLAVVRFPLDFYPIIRRFMNRVRPRWVVLMELEIWPNFLKKANRMGAPVAVVNGRITQDSFGGYRRFGRTLPQFNRVSLFAAQDERYAERFVELCGNPLRVVVTGNVKVDGLRIGRLPEDATLAELRGFVKGTADPLVLVAGSTHEPEEALVLEAFRRAGPECRHVLVPRHPPRVPEIIQALEASGLAPQRLTALRAGELTLDLRQPLVVDTIGELERIYALADLVFVGGSLIPHGGHNMLEPAAQGLPVVYGPHNGNFLQEAALLEEAGAAQPVGDAEELADLVAQLLADPGRRAAMAEAGVAAVSAQRGATARTLAALSSHCGLAPPEAAPATR